jgi:hypothetical protein
MQMKPAILTALVIVLLLSCTIFGRLDWGTSDTDLVLPPMGRRGMGLGMMGRGMGPGMMNFSSLPPEVTQIPTATPGGQVTISYRMDVQPIFNRECVTCHGGSADLWLDSYERVQLGNSSGPVIVAGNPEVSKLFQRITGRIQPAMPLGGVSLSPNEINMIRIWIAEGAPNN